MTPPTRRTRSSSRTRPSTVADTATATVAAPPRSRAGGRAPAAARAPPARARRKTLTAYLFLAPFLLLFLTFVVAPGDLRPLDEPDQLEPVPRRAGLRRAAELHRPLHPRARDLAADFWKSMRATGIFVLISVPFLVVVPAAGRDPAEPADPGGDHLPHDLLRAVRARRRRHRRDLGLHPRHAVRHPEPPARADRPAVQHPLDRRRPVGLGLARRRHRVVDDGPEHDHLPGRPEGHQRRSLRGGVDRRRRSGAQVHERHRSRAPAGHDLHHARPRSLRRRTCSASPTC